MLLKHGRNGTAAFGMLWERRLLLIIWLITAMALIHQVVGGDGPVGFGRHTKTGDKVKLATGNKWKAAENPADLDGYKNSGGMNPCVDIEMDGATKDITVRYTKGGKIKNEGCMVDLLTTDAKTSVDFYIGIKNGNTLEKCFLHEQRVFWVRCPPELRPWYRPFKECAFKENLESSHKNTMPFIYSRTVAEFQSMRSGLPATGDGCPGPCSGNVVCRKWTGLAAGFAKDYGKVVRTVVGIGDPGGSYCKLATTLDQNDANFKITVDNAKMDWFKTEGCTGDPDGGDHFPRNTQCVSKEIMAQDMGGLISWEIEDPPANAGDSKYLFTFALLPQVATRIHTHSKDKIVNNYGIEEGSLNGPECDEIYVKFVRFFSNIFLIFL
uniref:Uncharacterized protein n=1 Tax=Meloidogyne hapla TaxID=6305 RepID=A0A1I8C024_MELHA